MLGGGALVASLLLWQQATQLTTALEQAEQAKISAGSALRIAETAQQKEVAARKLALQRANEARTTLDFFKKYVLAAPRPIGIDGGLGRDLTLRQALDQSLPALDREFRDQPGLEVELRQTLGLTYERLSEIEMARDQFDRAFQVATEHFGPTHIKTLGSLVNLGHSHLQCGNLEDAEQALLAAWEQLEHAFPKHPFTEVCLSHLASLDRAKGRLQAAAEKYQRVLAARTARVKAGHPDIAAAQLNLALAYSELGRLSEARALLQQVLEVQVERDGSEHPNTWTAMGLLASVETKFGNLSAATEIRRKLLDQKQDILGVDHLTTLGAHVNLATLLEDTGEITEAEKLLEVAVPRLREKHPQHHFTMNGMNALAGVWAATGKTTQSKELYQATFELSQELRGPEHYFTLGVRVNLANQWHRAGESGKALTTLRQVLKHLKQNYPDHEFTRIALQSLAQICMDTGQSAAAIGPLRALLEKQQAVWPVDDPRMLETQVRLANCQRTVGNRTAAQEILEQVMPTLRRDFRGHELLAIAAGELGSIKLDDQKVEMAAGLFEEAYQARVKEHGSRHPMALGALVNWGLADWMRGDLKSAVQRLEQARREFDNPLEPFYGICLKHLTAIYEELGETELESERMEEFEKWLVQQGGARDAERIRIQVRRAQREGDWARAKQLVESFELRASQDDPLDYCMAAGLRARLAEMAIVIQPTDLDPATIQKQVRAWLDRAEGHGLTVAVECQFDPAMRRYFRQQESTNSSEVSK